MRKLFCFMQQVAKEDAGIGEKQLLHRRRLKVSWVQNRTFMAAALSLVQNLRTIQRRCCGC